jgi:hypothetical protein
MIMLPHLRVQQKGVASESFRAMATCIISVGVPPYDMRSYWIASFGELEMRVHDRARSAPPLRRCVGAGLDSANEGSWSEMTRAAAMIRLALSALFRTAHKFHQLENSYHEFRRKLEAALLVRKLVKVSGNLGSVRFSLPASDWMHG